MFDPQFRTQEEQVSQPARENQNIGEQANQPAGENQDGDKLEKFNPPPKKTSKKIIIAIVSVLGVIVVGGGLLFAAQQVFDFEIPFLSKLMEKTGLSEVLSKETPQDVVKKMILNIENIKSSEDSFRLEFSEGDKVFNIKLEGKRDYSDSENRKVDYNFSFSQPGSNTNVSLALKYLDKRVYLNLVEVPEIPFFDLSMFKSQWFYLDEQARENLSGFYGIEDEKLKLQDEYNEEFLKKFKKADLFDVNKVFEEDQIGNDKVFHYSLFLNREGFLEFVDELEKLSQEQIEKKKLPVGSIQSSFDDIRDTLNRMDKDVPIEVWINKKDYFLRKMSIDFSGIDIIKGGQTSKADVALDIELNNINQPVEIEAPSDAQSLEEILQGIFGGWMQEMPLLKQDDVGFEMKEFKVSDSDQDNDNLTDQEEAFYGTDPSNPDTDGDGYLDGDEVMNDYNPLGEGDISVLFENFENSDNSDWVTLQLEED